MGKPKNDAKIYHPFRSFPNQLVVTVGFELGTERTMEEVAFDVVIEKPESELRTLTFSKIEELAVERALVLLASLKTDSN